MSGHDILMLGTALLFLLINGFGAAFTIAGRSKRINGALAKKRAGLRETHDQMPIDRAL